MRQLTSFRYIVPLTACLAMWMAGCNPKIGDDCTNSTDCSVNGDRLCDTTQPGGYCTIFNCEPDTCPDEAQCIAFDTELDPACEDQRWARFERTFCMRRCSSDSDCRTNYVCFDMTTEPNPWAARVADFDPEGTKICIAPYSGSQPGDDFTDVCSPYDGGFPDADSVAWPPEQDADHPDADHPDADEPDADEPDADEPDADEPDAEMDSPVDAAPDDAGEDAA